MELEIDKFIEKISSVISKSIIEEIKNHNIQYRNNKILEIASKIDHTMLKPEATVEQIIRLCEEAKEFKFASVCVAPWFVPIVKNQLKGSGVRTCTVIGFPQGAATTKAKTIEALETVENGTEEIDLYPNIAAIKSGYIEDFKYDLERVISAVSGRAIFKVVLETCLLNNEEKVKVCLIAKEAGAKFIKISTFLGTGKASEKDVKAIKQILGDSMGIKIDGGIKDWGTAILLINSGATRIGTSASINIIKSYK
ncbi:MAG: deoxyribose-phosphate aldolase [Candidatus Humimicrobiaceae bacterium]